MPKNIVLLSDGTGNSAAKLFKTNVWRLYQALDVQRADQIAFYDDGVGTETFKPLAMLGGGIGFGLRRNVLDLYTFLCRNYEPDDRIYAFGFSRGAFTIRTLVGLIGSQGIVPAADEPTLRREVRAAFERDRREFRQTWKVWAHAVQTRMRAHRGLPAEDGGWKGPPIEFVGVWDTVDAYGLPIDEMKRGVDRWLLALTFPDQRLGAGVKRARHAMALDDERRTFHPVLWDEKDETDPARITQVWFAGAHSNVGGGYPNDALAHVSLAWMMREATGLHFRPGALAEVDANADPNGELHNSRAGVAAYYRYGPRKLALLCDDTYQKVWIERPKIHESVLIRVQDSRMPYAPNGIPAEYDVVRLDGSIQPLKDVTDAAGKPLYESPDQATARAGGPQTFRAQERVWDRVWWRLLVYIVTLLASAVLVGMPAVVDTARVCEGRWCFLSPVAGALGRFTPEMADPWIAAYRVAPLPFALALLTLFVSLWISGRLALAVRDAAADAWRHVRRPGESPPLYVSGVVYEIRTSRILTGFWRLVNRYVVPFVTAMLILLGFVVGAVVIVNRVGFEVGSSIGDVCRASGRTTVIDVFDTNDGCADTGFVVRRGRRYRIELTAMTPWIDGERILDLEAMGRGIQGGFTAADAWRRDRRTGLVMYAATPLKRSLDGNWFEPMARIGAEGRDQYTLRNGYIEARSDGPLFLFVNDAVIGLPGLWHWFYDGNQGRARVRIREVGPARSSP